MDNTDPIISPEEGRSFEEIKIEGLEDSIILKLEPNKQFSPEQIEKMKDVCTLSQSWHGLCGDYIIFRNPDNQIHLYLSERIKYIWWHQKEMWDGIKRRLNFDAKLSDGGHYYITEKGNHILGNQVAEQLHLTETPYNTRYQIFEMDIGIDFEGRY